MERQHKYHRFLLHLVKSVAIVCNSGFVCLFGISAAWTSICCIVSVGILSVFTISMMWARNSTGTHQHRIRIVHHHWCSTEANIRSWFNDAICLSIVFLGKNTAGSCNQHQNERKNTKNSFLFPILLSNL